MDFPVLYRILPYCLVNIHHLRMMLGGRVALEEGPMIIYGSGGGWGRGGFILFHCLSRSSSPSPPLLPSFLAWNCVQYSSSGQAGTMEGVAYKEGRESICITVLQQCVRQGTEYVTYSTSQDISVLKEP